MREGWKKVKLGEVIAIRRGLTYKKDDEVGYSTKIVLRSNNVNLSTHLFDYDDLKYLRLDFDIPNDKYIRSGELLMCMSNGSKAHLGKVALYEGEDDIYAFGGFMSAISHNELVISKFLYYALITSKFKEYIKTLSAGANINNLKVKDIETYSIELPSLDEQHHIVELLDAEFAKIDAIKANAEKQLQYAKDLFQSALKDLLTPKEGWTLSCIGDIADIRGGKRVPKGYKFELEPTEHIYIRVSDFNNLGTIDTCKLVYISDEVYEQIKRYIITDEDVYISIAGTIGKAGIIPSELNGANLTENACRLVLNGKVYKRFIYYYTLLNSFKERLRQLTKTGSQPKLAITRLATAAIAYPNIEEQKEIVKLLDLIIVKLDNLQSNYEKTITLCNDLKQSILKDIFG